MRVTKMVVDNFKGLTHAEYDLTDKITIMLAKNGSGKTSFIDALRYGLTGAKPDGEMINKTAEGCSVTLFNELGESFTRMEFRNKPAKFKLNGHNSTKTAMEEVLSSRMNIDIAGLNIITSGELLGHMSPSEIGDTIMNYMPDSLTAEKVISFISNITPGMKDVLENNLSDGEFGAAEIENLNSMVRESRKTVNAKLKEKNGYLSALPKEAPAHTKEQILSRQKEISGLVKEQAAYVEKKRAYDKAVADHERISKQMEKMLDDGPKHKVEKPDPQQWMANRTELSQKETAAQKELAEKNKVLNTLQNSLAQMKKALENLTKPYCPLSDKLCCTTDKTPLKAEFEKTIVELEEGIATQTAAIKDTEMKVESIKEEIVLLEQQKTDFNNYVMFITSYNNLKKSLPEIPEEPKKVEFEKNPDMEMSELNKELNQVDGWEKAKEIKKEIESLKVQAEDYDRLVKASDPKGEIKRAIIREYKMILEEYCNAKAQSLGTGFKFKFEEENGMKITCDTGNGSYLPFDSLSGGEQMYMLYILMDMFNCLTNSGILIMDELSVLDDENFKKLLAVIKDNDGEYNNIILAGVRGEDSAKECDMSLFSL